MLNYGKLKSKRPKRAKTPRSRLIAEADTIFSKIVRMRDGHCQWPGCRATTIYNHHVFSRRYLNTRWDLENGISLCIYHHSIKAHGGDAEEFRDMILRRMGESAFLRMKARAYMRAAPITAKDVSLILIGLRARLKEMKE